MTLDSRTQALLELVEADRQTRCEALLDEARIQAAAALGQARAQARSQLQQARDEDRHRCAEQLAAARAELATLTRLHAQRRVEALLARGWEMLPRALDARWQDPMARQQWVQAAVQAALAALPPGEWTVTHPVDWPDPERQACLDDLAARLGQRPAVVADTALAAGLRIAAAGNVIDATPAGLLADRAEIGGRLVAEWDACRGGTT